MTRIDEGPWENHFDGKTIERATLEFGAGMDDVLTLKFTDGSAVRIEGAWHNDSTGGLRIAPVTSSPS